MTVMLHKYHGLGNDYLVLDPAICELELNPERIRRICDRNRGFGSDGILYGPVFTEDDIPCVQIFNPDGSEAEKSGNGIRIFARYLHDCGYIQGKVFTLRTMGGDVRCRYLDPDALMIQVMMGKADFTSTNIPVTGDKRQVVDEEMVFGTEHCRVTCMTIGNPHCVIPMENISRAKAQELGPLVERAQQFPQRINMQLLKVVDRANITIEIYERGVGYTLASGSSSCAAACAAHRLGLVDTKITVTMPGGQLTVSIADNGDVQLTGPVESVGVFHFSEDFLESISALV